MHGSMGSLSQCLPLAAALHSTCGFGVVAFDGFGCGRSPKPNDWEAYAFDRLGRDLDAVWAWLQGRPWRLPGAGAGAGAVVPGPVVVVAHSYGTHLAMGLALRLHEAAASHLSASARPLSRPRGLVLLAGCLTTADGGHPIFRLPTLALNLLQPTLTRAFLASAFEPAEQPTAATFDHAGLLAAQRAAADANPMHVCRAYYRQVGPSGIPAA